MSRYAAVDFLWISNPFRLPQNSVVHGFLIPFESLHHHFVALSSHQHICIKTACIHTFPQ